MKEAVWTTYFRRLSADAEECYEKNCLDHLFSTVLLRELHTVAALKAAYESQDRKAAPDETKEGRIEKGRNRVFGITRRTIFSIKEHRRIKRKL
ncbi:hypothetical protein J6590_012785 [Homalodisca vitripennis]|nr:hypothetical protein J6590_012785 [Homalodisca vitripennis]